MLITEGNSDKFNDYKDEQRELIAIRAAGHFNLYYSDSQIDRYSYT